MRTLKRMLVGLLIVVVALSAIIFTLENRALIQFSFLGWETPAIPSALLFSLVFVAGGLLGWFFGVFAGFAHHKGTVANSRW
ncbi:DUF1049 domain-containing protein [Pseudomonas aeruginosa]|uniref:lipopolysaccharide assembly protein LapA domain-containing protein n=1 Tax=Pseudomonas aeruginosa TaxID=287 RepID=UPI00191EA746|nr:lipopolysaccharide assembly protein LapA domain-containing protein [Pseudomonas aeruginosa]MBX6576750.1 DUF1049 domain-containing protein [Pseudomonas aeruginosa]MBX6831920.1 DUF1049 domain-containing protein [Pseudomonas aeruginosa]QQV59766.1 DUF1049 domain-containing protein [Pseudomonas aeruginosa]